ncbi:hypothetical protein Trydic_g17778 [Trypoxylus dichotomus]
MTVNDYKETACATAGVNEDVEIESDHVLQTNSASQNQQQQDSEHLLGRVLAASSPEFHDLIKRPLNSVDEPSEVSQLLRLPKNANNSCLPLDEDD